MWKIINLLQLLAICLITIISGLAVVVGALIPGSVVYKFISQKIWGPGLLAIAGIKLIVSGRENVLLNRPCIFISNHESHFDTPAIYTAVPKTLFFIAKKELKKVPFLGWAMWAAGIIFVDRTNREKAIQSINKAGKLIERGKDLISFPEGTRSKDGKLKAFKKGTFALAKIARVPVIPIGVEGTHEVCPSGSWQIRPGKVHVNIGKPVFPEEYLHLSNEEFIKMMEQKITDLVNSRGEILNFTSQIKQV